MSWPAGNRQCVLGCRRRTPPVGPPADRASSSRERSTSRGRGAARSSSRESGRGGRGRGRPARPSPSPTGGRVPRFDPTAFVKAKEKKQREIKMKLARISPLLPIPRPFAWSPDLCPHLSRSPSPVSITCRLLHLSPSPSGSLFSPDTPLARSVTPHAFSLLRPRDLRWVSGLGCGPRGRSAALPHIAWAHRRASPSRSPGSSSGTDWAAEEAGTARPSPGLATLRPPPP